MMQKNNFRILIVDDEIEYQRVVSMILDEAGYSTHTCSNGKEALEYIDENDVELVITDLKMPIMGGDELVENICGSGRDIDIIVITAFGSIESAVDAIRKGATDYFVKSGNLDELLLKVEKVVEMRRIKRRGEILIKKQNLSEFFLDSKNRTYRRILDMCERTADTNINILLLGESGVGKEVVANYIHRNSKRANEPLIPVNCQVFPEGVIESELFGHERGAFTGAVGTRIGKFEEANYGTLFMDEIGDLPLMTQGKLLRALETRTIERVGSNKSIALDVRFVFATNKNLSAEIEAGRFREDLLYRINTLTLTLPPLRERREDLPGLIDFFLKMTANDQKKRNANIDGEVMDRLLNYDYPGNIRELKNMIERMMALSVDGNITKSEFLTPGGDQYSCIELRNGVTDLRSARGLFEKKYISEMLSKKNCNVEQTAIVLGITSRQLWNKISQYEIDLSDLK